MTIKIYEVWIITALLMLGSVFDYCVGWVGADTLFAGTFFPFFTAVAISISAIADGRK
jgi:hypothetical protein